MLALPGAAGFYNRPPDCLTFTAAPLEAVRRHRDAVSALLNTALGCAAETHAGCEKICKIEEPKCSVLM